ncbi:hypothetical protein KAR91_40895 [Candidatus Pacearchaeota archaeon]|nr:hypothetical protein [Candidatus Pacearchaeota archaeon]
MTCIPESCEHVINLQNEMTNIEFDLAARNEVLKDKNKKLEKICNTFVDMVNDLSQYHFEECDINWICKANNYLKELEKK